MALKSFTSQGALQVECQVLDVGVNKPFKHYMRQQFETFMLSNGQKIERENYKGNHNEHVEVNRLRKKHYEKVIPFFRTTTLSFLT